MQKFEVDKSLIDIMGDCGTAARLLNLLHDGHFEIDVLALRELVVSAQYSLLSALLRRPTLQSPKSIVRELCRAGLLLYLLSLTNEFPPATTTKLINNTTTLLQQIKIEDDDLANFRLWLLCLSGSMTSSLGEKKMILSLLAETISASKIPQWEDARTRLKSFFWVDKIYEREWSALWELAWSERKYRRMV